MHDFFTSISINNALLIEDPLCSALEHDDSAISCSAQLGIYPGLRLKITQKTPDFVPVVLLPSPIDIAERTSRTLHVFP